MRTILMRAILVRAILVRAIMVWGSRVSLWSPRRRGDGDVCVSWLALQLNSKVSVTKSTMADLPASACKNGRISRL